MRRLGILALLAIAALLAVALALWLDPPGPRRAGPASRAPNEPRPAARAAASPSRQPTAEGSLHLVGRCLAADGTALPDAQLCVHASRDGRVTAASAADGRFDLLIWPVADIAVQLEVRHPAHLDLERRWPTLTPGDRLDVGDLRLSQGCVVSGVVRELDGRPAAGIALRVQPDGEWATEPRHASATTATDGTFVLDAALAPGRWYVRSEPREFAVPVAFVVGAQARRKLDLTLAAHREPRRIVGMVVDADDDPVEGVTVRVLEPADVAPVVSGADGTFRLLDWSGRGDVAQVILQPTDGGPPDPAASIAWGSRDVRLSWRRGTTLRVSLRGSPLDVECVAERDPRTDHPGPFASTVRRRFVAGVCELPSLLPGRYAVWAESEVCAAWPAVVEVDGQRLVEVELAPREVVERTVEVRHHDGTPAVHVQVAWLPDGCDVSKPASRWSLSLLLTNGEGRAQVAGLVGDSGRWVFRVGDGPEVVRAGVVFNSQPWREVLPAGATVVVRAAPSAAAGELCLRSSAGALFSPPRATLPIPNVPRANSWWLPSAPRFVGVPPGDWQLELHRHGRVVVLSALRGLVTGETRYVEVALPAPEAGRLVGTVRWNGRAYTQGVRLVRQVGAGEPGTSRGASDDGEVSLPSPGGRIDGRLPAGRYRAYLGKQPVGSELELRDGADLSADLHLETRPVRIRVLRGAQPWAGVRLTIALQSGDVLECAATDDYGVTERDVPFGGHVCVRLDSGRAVTLGPLVVVRAEGPQLVQFAP